eukprot:512794-Pelagomonas_calceolata.AAC.2
MFGCTPADARAFTCTRDTCERKCARALKYTHMHACMPAGAEGGDPVARWESALARAKKEVEKCIKEVRDVRL